MIRQTLDRTKAATYSIHLPSPDPGHGGMPMAAGTGFFIDESGYFLTAFHVIEGAKAETTWLMQSHEAGAVGGMVQWPEIVQEWSHFDLALLKADFERNREGVQLQGLAGFPHLEIELSPLLDGTPVYAFGYPLPLNDPPTDTGGALVGHVGLGPRTTSAIIASSLEHTRVLQTAQDARVYVLDKALNYGNSGGPVVATETGRVFGVCSRFQPVTVPQPDGVSLVWIPSLYGVASAISNVAADLRRILPGPTSGVDP